MDLSTLTLSELRQLQEDIKKQIQIVEQAELATARDKILAIAQGVGLSLNDLIGSGMRAKTGSVAVRYQNPHDKSQQWTGRGRQPKWAKEWVESGKSMDLLKV